MTTPPPRTMRTTALLVLLLGIILHTALPAATFTSYRSGAWSDPATWGPLNTVLPGPADDVIIRYSTIVTIPAGYAASCASLAVGSVRAGVLAASLAFGDASSALTVGGPLVLGSTGSGATTTGSIDMTAGGILSAAAISAPAPGSWSPGSGTVVLTGTSTLPAQLTTFHHLTLNGVTTAAANLALSGNWTNNAGFTPGAFTVTFFGTANQDLGGSASTGFHNLTINKSGGTVTLQQSATVAGSLVFASFSAGGLALGNADLALSAASSISGCSALAFVITNGTGMLTRSGVGGTPVVFPVGPSASSYNPVTISNAGTPDAFAVRVQEGFDNTPYSAAYVNRQWTILEGTPDGSISNLSFTWTCSTDEAAGFSHSGPLCVGRWDGGSWQPTSASCIDNPDGTHSASVNGITTFSTFGIGNVGAMPVELQSFSARLKGTDAVLKWTTATETNNYGFEIERSADRAEWQRVGFVPGHGSSAAPKNYAFTDAEAAAAAPALYYRLRQIDRDGTTEYSAVAEVRAGATGFELAQNYPNPFAGTTTLGYILPRDGHVTLHLHDLLGNEVAVLAEGMQPAGSHALHLDPAALGLHPGQYLCVLRSGGRVATRTLVYMP